MNDQASFRIGDKLPRTLEDKRENECGSSAQAGSFCVVGASARGRLHSHNNIPRDDAFAVRFNGTWLAVAVADGAGSRTLSRYGASYSTNRLCSRLLQATITRKLHRDSDPFEIESQKTNDIFLPLGQVREIPKNSGSPDPYDAKPDVREQTPLESIMRKAFRYTRADLKRFAFRSEVQLEDFHSTLLGLLLNTKTMEMGIGQIGDGLILGLDDKKEARLLAEPPTTDDPGASYFITQDDWEQYLYIRERTGEEVERFSTFYLMTDGVANDCQYGPPPDILKIWANDMDREIRLVPSLQVTAERLKNYLANYKAKGSFDDRTLVVIYRNNEGRAT